MSRKEVGRRRVGGLRLHLEGVHRRTASGIDNTVVPNLHGYRHDREVGRPVER